MSNQSVKEEMQNIADRLLIKLKQLPEADTVEIISFTIILVFIGMLLLMTIIMCSFCCCDKKRRSSRVDPKPKV
ncbi:unnamed protein product [Ranitomeya imitator]|uniref:Small integral membrane protein 5 n=1 Tax=Ranitomeya imitator TaxID=111125 RepID=A0ABN9M0C9_9NEOB|nr:unnamed protein product [Ranitomeya imitator]